MFNSKHGAPVETLVQERKGLGSPLATQGRWASASAGTVTVATLLEDICGGFPRAAGTAGPGWAGCGLLGLVGEGGALGGGTGGVEGMGVEGGARVVCLTGELSGLRTGPVCRGSEWENHLCPGLGAVSL